jgi:hypothetical protein
MVATNHRNNDQNNNKPSLTDVSGYRVSNRIRVVGHWSTYHGQKGVVWRFCQNHLTKKLYVVFDGNDEMRGTQRCMFVKSLAHVRPATVPTAMPHRHRLPTTTTHYTRLRASARTYGHGHTHRGWRYKRHSHGGGFSHYRSRTVTLFVGYPCFRVECVRAGCRVYLTSTST